MIDLNLVKCEEDFSKMFIFVFQYLKQLDKDLYEKLIDIYRTDFHIFGYPIPDFESL